MKHLISLLFVISIAGVTKSQSLYCGSEPTKADIEFIDTQISPYLNLTSARLSSNRAFVEIPIKFHFIVESEGDLGLSDDIANQLLSKVNRLYESADMAFVHVGEYNRIVDPENYNFNSPNEGAVAVGNELANTINIFFFGSARVNGSPVCGYATFPAQRRDRIVVAYDCVTGINTTLEHELGHYFSLYHTHGKTNNGTTDEFVNGSNCQNTGDDLCDTPADPNLSGKVSSSCVYTANERDANGDVFRPDPSNIMAYSPDICQNYFSPQQFERIRRGFETGRNYLNFTTDDLLVAFSQTSTEVCVGESIKFSAVGFGIDNWRWEFEGGSPATSTDVSPTVFYESGGSFNVKLVGSNNAGNEAILDRQDLILVDDPLSRAINNSQSESFEEVIIGEKYGIKNPDNALTFELADVDITGSGKSLFMNNYFNESNLLPLIDEIQFIPIQTLGVKSIKVEFYVAYQGRARQLDDVTESIFDSLQVNIKTYCDQPGTKIFKSGGIELIGGITSSVPITSENPYVPFSSSDWVKFSATYDIKGDEEFLEVVFRNISYNGNNLYIDDLEIIPDYTVVAPDNFRVIPTPSTLSNRLTWRDNSVNEVGFVIERKTNEDEFVIIGEVGPNLQTYTDNTVQSGNLYTYRIYAKGFDINKSSYSEEIVISNFLLGTIEHALTLYPNPTTSILTIDGNLDLLREIKVSDISGQEVAVTIDGNEIKLDHLEAGIYFVSIMQENISKTYKIIKK